MKKSIKNPKIGDKIEVVIKGKSESEKGTLLESSDAGILLLKLVNGYNIGLKKEDISEILVLEKKKDDAKKLLSAVYKSLDKAVKSNVIKKNAAARKKSRLTKLVNSL